MLTSEQSKELEKLLKEIVELLTKLNADNAKTILGDKLTVTLKKRRNCIKIIIK